MLKSLMFYFLLLFSVAGLVQAEEGHDFEQWLQGVKEEALAKGVSQQTIDRAFKDVAPIPRIIELDRKQPEFTLTLDQYLKNVVPKRRVDIGKQRLVENEALLQQIADQYGVQPRFIVAFWGIETDFGRVSGGYSVIAALSTLAYDGRRSDFFRRQLMDALQILEAGHISPEQMKGSWAGAMGQAQFMPSTFMKYAVDGDGDGKIDIWNSRADVFASAAHYLSQVGWNSEQTWGREVEIPANLDNSLIDLNIKKELAEWQRLGVRRLGGRDLPMNELQASLVRPDDTPGSRAFLVYENYHAILDWNRSQKFATAVGTLSDLIAR